ncbi:MAG TPA: MFS transporter [Steroidobacteraceae bacterium]|nr:MFS transporter [Steroidobacteraceae bacterium]
MNAVERRSVGALAAIYASRMLGMFMLLPVLALHARSLSDYSPVLLGLAMGAYGLTQALLQIPFGRWSDRYGRKPLITLGLLFYAAGSLVGMFAQSVALLALARGVQGAGAVSASVTALLADLTRSEVRTRAMAVIGISIGLSFVVALIAAPALDAAIGVPGIFGIMLAMALFGLALLHLAVPPEPHRHGGPEGRRLSGMLEIVARPQLRPLYFGMFALHAIMTATFLSVPQVLQDDLGLPSADHWQVYLGVFVVSIAGTVPLVLSTERGGRGGALLMLSVALAGVAQAILGLDHGHRWVVLAALTLFFASFNYLEARLPALLTHAAPAADRGAALGVFATAQFLGAFFGGAAGGILLRQFGISGVFWGCAALALGWALLVGRSGAPATEPVSG